MARQLPPRTLLVTVAAAVVVVAAFAPGMGGELLDWDDDRFVADNPLVHGLSLEHVRGIFSGPHQEAYHPLHLLSYAVDHALFGLRATGYRVHNLLLYLLALLLLYRLLRRLELEPTAALAGVMLFAVHPLHVEAVVWVSARKEALSLCFMLGAALLHLGAAGWRDWRRWLALLLFGAALLTKTSTVVLPLLLVAVDLLVRRRRLLQSLLPVLPMLLLALGVGLYVVGLWQDNAMTRPQPRGVGAALSLVLGAHGHHLSKLFLPLGLSPVYPIDRQGSFGLQAGIGLAGLVGLLLLAWRLRGGHARLAVAWWLLALLPVLNIVPVYFFVQDRYAFVASAALAVAAAAAVDHLARRGHGRPVLAVAALLVAALALASGLQARHWRSSRALWQRAVAAQPSSYYAHLALGHTLRRAGEPGAAVKSYRRAVALQPRFTAGRIALCLADTERRGGGKPAARRTEQQLRRHWLSADGLARLAGQLLQQGEPVCAALAESRAHELRSPTAAERIAAASRWTLAGHGAGALRHLGRVSVEDLAPRLRPAYHEVRAQALLLLGRRDEANRAFRTSLQLAPRAPSSLLQAAQQLEQFGRRELARLYRAWAERINK